MPKKPENDDFLEIREFKEGNMPFDVDALQPSDFTHLGEWNEFMREDGYGVIYRLGLKEDFVDHEGDPALLVCIFAFPTKRTTNDFTPASMQRFQEDMTSITRQISIKFSAFHPNVIVGMKDIPESMMVEIRERFRSVITE